MSNSRLARTMREYRKVLTDVSELMLGCGLVRSEVEHVMQQALAQAKEEDHTLTKDASGYLAMAALVLDAWHRDRRYLTSKAAPKPIPLFGACPSVESLARAEVGHARPRFLVNRLKGLKLVVPHAKGMYKPASNVALLTALDPLAIQHVARSLSMLLATIRKNLVFAKPSQRLIERIAEVPDLPVELVPAFRRFTQQQGYLLLRTVNDWLESRRARVNDNRARTVRAGIHVHSYIGTVARPRRAGRRTRSVLD